MEPRVVRAGDMFPISELLMRRVICADDRERVIHYRWINWIEVVEDSQAIF
jgi:hypothetical protein